MRTVFCACDHRLIAVDDDLLFQQYRNHVDEAHPNDHIADQQIRAVIAACAHDYEKEPSQQEAASTREVSRV